MTQDPRWAADVAEQTGYLPRSILAAPLETEQTLIGVVEVLDRDTSAPRCRARPAHALAARPAGRAVGRVGPAVHRLRPDAARRDRDRRRHRPRVAGRAPWTTWPPTARRRSTPTWPSWLPARPARRRAARPSDGWPYAWLPTSWTTQTGERRRDRRAARLVVAVRPRATCRRWRRCRPSCRSPASGRGAARPAPGSRSRSSTAASTGRIPRSAGSPGRWRSRSTRRPAGPPLVEGPHADLYGHGTACAGIIRRAAPECEIYSVRVLGARLSGRAAAFVTGLRWARRQRDARRQPQPLLGPGVAVRDVPPGGRRGLLRRDGAGLRGQQHPGAVLPVGVRGGAVGGGPGRATTPSTTTTTRTRRWSSARRASTSTWRGPAAGRSGRPATRFACPHVTGLVARLLSKHPGLDAVPGQDGAARAGLQRACRAERLGSVRSVAEVDFRILSWNVHGLRDDRAVLSRVVRDLDPDVVCVQESPKYLRWRAKCAALARGCGQLYVAGGGTTGGSALLGSLRVDVKGATEVCLSRQLLWPARGVAAAVVSKGGARLTVLSVHLPLDAAQRLEHTMRVLQVRAALGGTARAGGRRRERAARPRGLAGVRRRRDARPGAGQRADLPGHGSRPAHRRRVRHRGAGRAVLRGGGLRRASSAPATTARSSSRSASPPTDPARRSCTGWRVIASTFCIGAPPARVPPRGCRRAGGRPSRKSSPQTRRPGCAVRRRPRSRRTWGAAGQSSRRARRSGAASSRARAARRP